MLSRFFALLLALPIAAHALNPNTALQDYNRVSWTNTDGAPPEIHSMAQTADGFLWMTGPSGLYRFDGVRFEKRLLPGSETAPRRRVGMVRAHPNGDLWITYALSGGLSVLHPNGKLEDIVPIGKLNPSVQMAFDDNGDIWTVSYGGMVRIRQGKTQIFGPAQGLPKDVTDVRIDRYHRLWVTSSTAAHLYDRATEKFQLVRSLPRNTALIESPDGRIWTANYEKIQALPAPADTSVRMSAPNVINAPGYGSDWIARFDRDGNLWQLKCPNSLCVTPASVVAATDTILAPPQSPSQTKPAPGTFSPAGNAIIEDREHNIWVATLEGVDRYRDSRLQRIRLSNSRSTYTMVTDENGEVWAADPFNAAVWRLKAGAEPEMDPSRALLVSTDASGALLLAKAREVERRHKGKVEVFPLPPVPGADGKPQDLTVLGLTDDGKRLWLVTFQTGLIGRRDGQWLPRAKFNLPPGIILGVPGVKPGHLWIATGDGNIALFDENEKLTSYPAPMIGVATGIYTGEDIVASGDQGVAVLVKGAFRQLQAADPDVLQDVSGLAVSADGDRWLNGGKGLVHVRRDDWKASLADPNLPLRYELFGVQEGYVGKAMLLNRHPSAMLDKDGQLWLASTGGILRFDTRSIARNTVAPVADISGLRSGAASYGAKPELTLPAGSQNLSINYTAASLRRPDAVRFQYRMEGSDNDWQDAGPRRTAYYTNMAPGAYRFQVRAMNEDGIWSTQPASLAFELPPTMTQTLWFKAACALAAAGALYALYLYRLRIVTARLEERMEVRLAERERIARTLHDTFLQTVQGVVLRLDTAVDALPDGSAARQTLAPVLHSARASISEGRAQVHELRSAAADEVESRLREVAALLSASYPGVQFELSVAGERSVLRAEVVDEISEIGREAVRNAFQHAQACQIAVQLDYGAQRFSLQVRDNGKGMAAAPVDGHWGLVGMRERAGRIGAALDISSAQEQGSSVTITLPARRAYAVNHPSWWRRLFRK